jgi:hypothetical protein
MGGTTTIIFTMDTFFTHLLFLVDLTQRLWTNMERTLTRFYMMLPMALTATATIVEGPSFLLQDTRCVLPACYLHFSMQSKSYSNDDFVNCLKSWFDGHSFASGLFPFADGKSQESSSEAVNCYYGAYLWTTVRWDGPGSQEKINFAKLLLAMEIRGAKTYWHMLPQHDVDGMDSIHSMPLYNEEFEEGLMVGNLGMMDVTVSTWFGVKRLYVHMINFMPVTAITKELFGASYIGKEFNEIIKPIYDQVEMAWRGYTVADKAFVDPNGAWNDATKLRSYELDSGLSQSQVYYWISSMNKFNVSSKSEMIQSSNLSDTADKQLLSNASCEIHKGCAALSGQCCPSNQGIMLGCCNEDLE